MPFITPWGLGQLGLTQESDSSETYVLVQAGISLRCGLPPDDLTRGETHDDIDVRCTFGDLVDIMAKTVCFGKKNLGQVVGLVGR